MEYIGYWLKEKDSPLYPAKNTAKVNCKLHSHYLYLSTKAQGHSSVKNNLNMYRHKNLKYHTIRVLFLYYQVIVIATRQTKK
jgi:hypothetical protein